MAEKKIMILAGDKEFGKSLSDYFTADGSYGICGVFNDGVTGLNNIESEKPDVVLMDLILPELDGLSILERLQKKNNKTKVIVLASFYSEEIINILAKKGATYCITKPFDFDFLKNRIQEFIVSENSAEKSDKVFKRLKNNNNLDERITNLFLSVGIPAHVKGYGFLREAVKIVVYNPHVINNITKIMYPEIAKRFNTSASKVERAIRHAISVACARGRLDNINTIFGVKIIIGNERPTNSEFIALIADRMILEGA